MKAPYIDAKGEKTGDIDLAPEIFETQINVPVMHAVVRAELAAARSGTASTKTRAEVRGGGRKPWRQKGTGRARHGSIREPQWVGGGIAHGPKPRDYSMRINRKERALALRSALSDRAREGNVVVVDLPDFAEPETKKAVQLLDTWGAQGKVLFLVGPEHEDKQNLYKSFRNLPNVLLATYATTYTVLAADVVVVAKDVLDAMSSGPVAATAPSAGSDAVAATAPSAGSDASAHPASPVGSETRVPDESPSEGTAAATSPTPTGPEARVPDESPPGGTATAASSTSSTATPTKDEVSDDDEVDEGGEARA